MNNSINNKRALNPDSGICMDENETMKDEKP